MRYGCFEIEPTQYSVHRTSCQYITYRFTGFETVASTLSMVEIDRLLCTCLFRSHRHMRMCVDPRDGPHSHSGEFWDGWAPTSSVRPRQSPQRHHHPRLEPPALTPGLSIYVF